jgi:hypothetical protein
MTRRDGSDPAGDPLEQADALLGGMIDQQRAKVIKRAREVMPDCSPEDVLNPDGVEPLAGDRAFNYEDGLLAGLLAAQIALRASLLFPRRRGEAPPGALPSIHD